MKRLVESTGATLSWFGGGLVVSGLLTISAPGHHREDQAYCPGESGEGDEEGENSWDFVVRPVPPHEMPNEELDEPAPSAWHRAPSERATGVGDVPAISPKGTDSRSDPDPFADDLASVRAELAQLSEARAAEQCEIRELRERVQKLERKVDDLLALQDFDAEEALVDPHARWIAQNFEELRRFPDMFVALDPERGILVHAADQGEFAAKLEALSPEENERVMLFHTSMYLRG